MVINANKNSCLIICEDLNSNVLVHPTRTKPIISQIMKRCFGFSTTPQSQYLNGARQSYSESKLEKVCLSLLNVITEYMEVVILG